MLCGQEGSHRSDVALAIRHRLSGLSIYRLNSQQHCVYATVGVWHLYLTFTIRVALK